jgi:DNA (cytosine-5)-methyltransferase 1
MEKVLTNGTLCSGGYDGFATGAEIEGIPTLFNCEINPWRRNKLKQLFPNTIQYTDVTKEIPEERPNILSITSECQDISIAKSNAVGIFGSRSIVLFNCLAVCETLKPDYILIENSNYLTQRGLEFVLCELARIGYDAEWQTLPLKAVGVQQNRKRLYIAAYSSQIASQRGDNQPFFRQSILQEQFTRVYPGWRTRADIPTPRTIQKADGYKDYRQEIMALGDMLHPVMAQYLFRCVKAHANNQ